MSELVTPRLRLRQCSFEDLDALSTIRGDAEVMKYIGNGSPQTRAQVKELLQEILAHWQAYGFGRWVVTLKNENHPIGLCGLSFLDNTPEVELGYLLAKAHWGKGLATEIALACLRYGFDVMKFDRIVAIAYPENLASQNVMKKIGMRYIKHTVYFDQEVVYFEISKDAFSRLTSLTDPRNN